MKTNKYNRLLWKLLLYFAGFIVVVIILNNFIMPWYVSEPEEQVPKVVGMKVEQAMITLKGSKLTPVIADTNFNDKYPKGTILFQRPNGGDTVKIDRRVYLFVSGGEPVVQTPELVGKSVREAKFSLERLGLKLGSIQEVVSDKPENMIFDQQFAVGTPLKKGDSVGVTISAGQDFGKITVPDLILKPLSVAESILADSSLKVGKINYQQSISFLPNTVLDQYPSKGTKLNKGDAVDLFVAKTSDSGN
jgi:eukaryotic-like serine/threonine-protein kinase